MSQEDLLEKLTRGFAAALGRAPDPALLDFVERGKGDQLPVDALRQASLVHWDTNSVHHYIFDTSNAVVVRRASMDLKELDEDLLEGSCIGIEKPEQVLYAGGGNGVAVVPTTSVGEIRTKLHRLYAERTQVATCTVADAPLNGKPFGQQIAHLKRELARQRTLVGPDAEATIPWFAERCQVCGRRAAAVTAPRGKEGLNKRERVECAPCHRRLAHARRDRDHSEAEDFESIAGTSGVLGVVYLDGNGIGDTISSLRSPYSYRRFSRGIGEVLRHATDTTLEKYNLKEGKSYQKPISGGDDLILIVPGDRALPLARDLLRCFIDRCDEDPDGSLRLAPRPLGAAVGVALGKAKLPIRHLIDEAEDLLKKGAKQRIYKEQERDLRTALDFNVVDDGSTRRSFAEAARLVNDPPPLALSARPYTLEEFERFSRRRSILLEHLGGSQLHALRQVAGSGPMQLRSHVLYQIARHDNWKKAAKELVALDHDGTGHDLGDPLTDADLAVACWLPDYSGHRALDVGDLLEVEGYWKRGLR